MLARAGFLTRNLWVTPYDPGERYPTGDYPNQSTGGDGLPRWTKERPERGSHGRGLWYTFGQTHIPRIEDWPVMPVSSVGFLLRPDGFFSANPALDLPPHLDQTTASKHMRKTRFTHRVRPGCVAPIGSSGRRQHRTRGLSRRSSTAKT